MIHSTITKDGAFADDRAALQRERVIDDGGGVRERIVGQDTPALVAPNDDDDNDDDNNGGKDDDDNDEEDEYEDDDDDN